MQPAKAGLHCLEVQSASWQTMVEFSNAEYVEMCEQFNVELQQSAAESPFSNGGWWKGTIE